MLKKIVFVFQIISFIFFFLTQVKYDDMGLLDYRAGRVAVFIFFLCNFLLLVFVEDYLKQKVAKKS